MGSPLLSSKNKSPIRKINWSNNNNLNNRISKGSNTKNVSDLVDLDKDKHTNERDGRNVIDKNYNMVLFSNKIFNN